MKLSGFKADYEWFSSKASDVARQLAFAGIAVVWIFKVDGPAGARVPNALLGPALLFCASLGFDLLQYLVGTAIWGTFHRVRERRTKPGQDPDVLAPPFLNYPGFVLFTLKQTSMVLGYFLLIKHLWGLWVHA